MSLLIFVVVILSCISCSVGDLAYDTPKATWNIRGAVNWSAVKDFLKQNTNVDVMAVQECGDIDGIQGATATSRNQCVPGSNKCSKNIPFDRPTDQNDGPFLTFFNPDGGFGPPPNGFNSVSEYQLKTGTGRNREMYVYHYELPNAKNSRTFLAILSELRAHEVIVLIENGVKRPVIGFRRGDKFYFSIHAGAFPQNPSDKTVESLEKFLKHRAGTDASFIIMGDFNKEPRTNVPANVPGMSITKVAPTVATHNGGKIFDYAFMGAKGNKRMPSFTATVQAQTSTSDHNLVIFQRN